MKCPNCRNNIIDSAIICPICNTQFAFAAPSSFNPNDGIYEEVKVEENPDNVEVVPNSVTVLPTEVDRGNEEEVSPYDNNWVIKEEKGEYMHIDGQPIAVDDTPYDPMERVVDNTSGGSEIVNANIIDTSYQARSGNMYQQNAIAQTISSVSANQGVDSNAATNVPQNLQNEVYTTVGEVSETYAQDLVKVRKMSDIFFKVVICMGVPVLFVLIGVLVLGENQSMANKPVPTIKTTTVAPTPKTNNVGNRSTFNYPMFVGNTTLASVYDAGAQKYTTVDVLGERFILGDEAAALALANTQEALVPGFEWIGFQYTVKFNDLDYLGTSAISPILKPTFYKWNGRNFIRYNDEFYFPEIKSVYTGGNITNNRSASIKVFFQVPIGEQEYSVCFGDLDYTLGCFARN